jgi:hypothetical protein
MATFGSSSAPAQVITNFDAVFASSLANYKKGLTDVISSSNAFFYELKKRDLWQKEDGGLYIVEDLLYENGQFDAYDGYDELPDTPTDGITQILWEWRQGAAPVTYSQKERKMNKHRLLNLIDTKIKQAENGFIEGFNKALLQGSLGNGSGVSLKTPWVNTGNGAQFIDPLAKLVDFDPTSSSIVGNIQQSTYSWWRNRTKTATATTYSTFLAELDNLYNNCSKGPGGPPKFAVCDQTTFELFRAAYYFKYRQITPEVGDYPFPNIKYNGMTIVWDEYMPDVFTGVANTDTYGTLYMLNPDTFRMVAESETDFTMTEWQKPPKGDSKLAHVLFMGQLTMNNRRKNGVYGKIPRTLTAS